MCFCFCCSGIGAKVADCIALFSLDSFSSVPVDTHVLQIAVRDYKFPKPQSKTLTKKVCNVYFAYFSSLLPVCMFAFVMHHLY